MLAQVAIIERLARELRPKDTLLAAFDGLALIYRDCSRTACATCNLRAKLFKSDPLATAAAAVAD